MIILNKNNSAYTYLCKAIDRSSYNFDETFKLASFVFQDKIGDTILLYNTVSSFFIETTVQELNNVLGMTGKNIMQSNYSFLIDNYFLVPSSYDDYTVVTSYIEKNVWHQSDINNFFKIIDTFTIFTTMDCNARCFYCYEKGSNKIKMSDKTAKDVANFIVKEYNDNVKKTGRAMRLAWFGGEPLYNYNVINIITDILRENGVPYKSTMISNGYLFTPDLVYTAKNKWNLSTVQITIDGTESVYNRVKHYSDLSNGENAFKTVVDNIKYLINAGIEVSVRLNVESYNVDDLKELVKYLNKEIGNHPKFSMYEHVLFETVNGLNHSEEERKNLYSKVEELKMVMHYYGYKDSYNIILGGPKPSHCMPDGGKGVTILPNGKLGQCEHMFDKWFIGDIYTPKEEWKYDIIKDLWYSVYEKGEQCKKCPLAAVCMPLTNCIDESICTEEKMNLRLIEYKFKVRNLYENRKLEISMNNKKCSCNNGKSCDNQNKANYSNILNKIATELELANDYKGLSLWERIKILIGLDVYRDPHKQYQNNLNGK